MKKVFHNIIDDYAKNLSARNKYHTNIIYSCCLSVSNNNKMITVSETTL